MQNILIDRLEKSVELNSNFTKQNNKLNLTALFDN